MTASAILTIDQIDAMARCTQEPARFREIFGESVEVSVEAIMAYSRQFDWADARRLLDADGDAEFAPVLADARIAYYKTLSAARRDPDANFQEAREQARLDWDNTLAPAWAAAYIATAKRAGQGA